MILTFIDTLRRNPMGVIIPSFAAFGGLLFGYDTGAISGILGMQYFKQTFGSIQSDGTYELDSNDKALMVAILSVGTFSGALLSYPCSDFLGRRWGLILAYMIFLIGVALQTASTTVPLFIVGRAIAGLGIGIVCCIAPMYQSECAPKSIRGAIVSAYQWFITFGLLVGAIVNNATKDIPSYACYRIPIGIQLIWGCILAIGMFVLPESPRYLVLKGQIDQAYKSQARLALSTIDDPQVGLDIKELIENVELLKTYGGSSYADCFKMGSQKNLLRTLVGISVQAWQQLTGINFIFYYGTTFFSSSGVSNSFMIMIAINLVNVGMAIPGIFLIDKVGRRYILIVGAIGMSVCEYTIGIVGTVVGQRNDSAQVILIVFSCLYIAFFAATWGPAPWVIISELYPISLQAKCMSLSNASNWLFNFAVSYAIPFMIDKDKGNLGSQIFFIWGSTCLGCAIFSIFFIWETKGLSLEQVNYLVRNSSPIKSAKLNRQLKTLALMENDTTTGNGHIDSSNKSLDAVDEIPQMSTDRDNSNENSPLLENGN